MALPRAGSFQDAVLQEMVFREQNLKYAEVLLSARYQEQLVALMIEAVTDPESVGARKKRFFESSALWLKLFEAELYQDRYMPSYQRQERERVRTAMRKEAERKVRDAEALKRVASFSEEG